MKVDSGLTPAGNASLIKYPKTRFQVVRNVSVRGVIDSDISLMCGLLCVCVFFPSILDIKFVGPTSRGHTGGRSHRNFNPPSFRGACLDFCREKDSAIPFPRRPCAGYLDHVLCPELVEWMLHSNHRPHKYKHPGRRHTFLDHLPSSCVFADPQWSVKG